MFTRTLNLLIWVFAIQVATVILFTECQEACPCVENETQPCPPLNCTGLDPCMREVGSDSCGSAGFFKSIRCHQYYFCQTYSNPPFLQYRYTCPRSPAGHYQQYNTTLRACVPCAIECAETPAAP